MKAGQFYHYDEATGIPIYSKTHLIKDSVRQTLCGKVINPKLGIDYCNEINVDCKRCLNKRRKN